MIPKYDRSPLSGQAHAANAVLLFALIAGSVYTFGELPDRIPTHFGFDGTPDAWRATTLLRWLILPLVASALTVMLYGCAWLMARFPDKMNMPDQKRFDALPLERKRAVGHLVQRFLFVLTVAMNLMLLGLHYGAYRVAIGAADGLPWYSTLSILAVVVGSSLSVIWLLMASQRLVREG